MKGIGAIITYYIATSAYVVDILFSGKMEQGILFIVLALQCSVLAFQTSHADSEFSNGSTSKIIK